MKVSVIIPCRNSSKFISEAIVSVINQTYKNIEVIVIDDASTDNTEMVVNQYPVIYHQNKGRGACAARNLGYLKSTGDYIQFLDADDLISPNKIASQLAQLENKVDVVSNGRWGRFYTNNPINEDIKWGPHESLQKNHDPVTWLCQNHMSQTACWLTPRKLIEKAGLWDESLTNNQDGEFFTRIVAQSKQVLYCPDAKVYYRSNLKNSITSKIKEEVALRSFYKTCISFEEGLLNLEKSERTLLACANKYQQFVYRAFPKCPELVAEAEKKIKYLGGSKWPYYKGGKIFNLLSKVFGWKTATRFRYILFT